MSMRAQDHIMLLVKTARERVVGFLLEMAARSPGSSEVDLPMSRQDIADYLGLTIETVSRMVTDLESRGAIALATSRRIVLSTQPDERLASNAERRSTATKFGKPDALFVLS